MDILDIECANNDNEVTNMNLKIVVAILMILLIVGLAVADAKSGGRGGKSSSFSGKSISSKASGSVSDSAAKVVGITTMAAAAKGTKKIVHLDDDFLDNDTENESDEQMPGMQALSAILATGILRLFSRRGTAC